MSGYPILWNTDDPLSYDHSSGTDGSGRACGPARREMRQTSVASEGDISWHNLVHPYLYYTTIIEAKTHTLLKYKICLISTYMNSEIITQSVCVPTAGVLPLSELHSPSHAGVYVPVFLYRTSLLPVELLQVRERRCWFHHQLGASRTEDSR